MTVGLIAGALLILRLVTKLRSEQPPHAKQAAHFWTKQVFGHIGRFMVILLIVASGMGTAAFTGLIEIVFQFWRTAAKISMMSPHWAPMNLGPQSYSYW